MDFNHKVRGEERRGERRRERERGEREGIWYRIDQYDRSFNIWKDVCFNHKVRREEGAEREEGREEEKRR